jgi:UDP-3-O-[3-hydroxymyristoyl] glucosamine N-acyltransferase
LRESAREQALIKRLVAREKENYDDGKKGSGGS